MPISLDSRETRYVDLLAALWDELEDLLDAHYGRQAVSPDGIDRLRLKLAEVRRRIAHLVGETEQCVGDGGPTGQGADALRRLGLELLRLLDRGLLDDEFDLSCGAAMVLAQNRILDEAQRLALSN
jgi:hypothetical protein